MLQAPIVDRPIRTAVVGYGMAGKGFHCHLIGLAPGLQLRGVVSSREERRRQIRQEQGCHAYAAFEEVLQDDEVDLVVLATPNVTHADLAVQAMDNGKHVITDKPMCNTLADCDRMIEASQRNGMFLNVFQNRRFDGDFMTVCNLLRQGDFGRVPWAEMAWQGFGPMPGWRASAEMGGGRFFDLGAHLVDQLCLLFPQAITSVYCRMHHDFRETDTESEAFLVIGFEDGCTGICDCSSQAAIRKPRFYVRGTEGAFEKYGLDPQERAMFNGDITTAEEDPALYGRFSDGKEQRTVPTAAGRWQNYYENVAAVLRGDAEPVVRLQEVRRAIGVLDAGVQSAQSGQVVSLHLPAIPQRLERFC